MLVSERKVAKNGYYYREFQGRKYRNSQGVVYMCTRKEKRKYLHRDLWEYRNGLIPYKFAIVPVDGDWEDFSEANWVCRPHAKNAPGMQPSRPMIEYRGKKYYKDLRPRAGYYLRQTPDYCYLHRAVWIDHHGAIPEGGCIHHIDGDRTNNNIENLQMFTSISGHRIHHEEMKRKA